MSSPIEQDVSRLKISWPEIVSPWRRLSLSSICEADAMPATKLGCPPKFSVGNDELAAVSTVQRLTLMERTSQGGRNVARG